MGTTSCRPTHPQITRRQLHCSTPLDTAAPASFRPLCRTHSCRRCLLGVKYAIAEHSPAGYVTAKANQTDSASTVYENPNALSAGIAASSGVQNSTLEGKNPFEKQNDLYSKILGREVELYTKIEATNTENGENQKQWSVTVPAESIGYLYINKDATAGSYWPVTLTIDQRTITNEAWRFDNNIRQIADASDTPSQHTVSIGVAEGYTDMPQDNERSFTPSIWTFSSRL